MNKHFRTALVLFLLGAFAWAVWQMQRRKENGPTYLGKPFTFWVRSLNPLASVQGGFYSEEFVANTNAERYAWHRRWETDSNALPVFVKALEVQNGTMGKLCINLWEKLPVGVREHAPVPFDAEHVRANAIRGIQAIGQADIEHVRADSAKGIYAMARAARPAIPALIGVLKNDESPLVRQFAVTALGTLSKSILDRDVMDAWIEATHDKDPSVRWWAAAELKQMAPNVAIEAGIK